MLSWWCAVSEIWAHRVSDEPADEVRCSIDHRHSTTDWVHYSLRLSALPPRRGTITCILWRFGDVVPCRCGLRLLHSVVWHGQ